MPQINQRFTALNRLARDLETHMPLARTYMVKSLHDVVIDGVALMILIGATGGCRRGLNVVSMDAYIKGVVEHTSGLKPFLSRVESDLFALLQPGHSLHIEAMNGRGEVVEGVLHVTGQVATFTTQPPSGQQGATS